MKIMVSACLLGENCKYNGKNNYNEKIVSLLKGGEVIPICPETAGGLPIPREPAEIVDGVVMNRHGVCVDSEFRRGAELLAKQALELGVEACVLQSRSPSCGVKQIYDGTFSKTLVEGRGVFAQMMFEAGIRIIDAEDAERLEIML